MLDQFDRSKAHTYQKSVFQYDELLGHSFIPNINVRINRPRHAYYVRTNAQGFRSDFDYTVDKTAGTFRILCFGDSFCAGDGVNNEDRITDLLANRPKLEAYNFGLSGSGVDHQLLIRERLTRDYEFDAVMLVIYIGDLRRNLTAYRDFDSRMMGYGVRVPKPYFERDGDSLALRNVPTPMWESVANESNRTSRRLRKRLGALSGSVKRRLGNTLYNKLTEEHRFVPEYSDPSSPGWRLMKSLLLSFVELSDGKPTIIVPVPHHDHLLRSSRPVYLERFREVTLASPNVQVVDILPALHQYDLKERRAFFLPQDGHFTRRANQIIARTILEQAGEVLRANRGGPVSELKGTSRNRGADYLLGISCFYHDSAAALLRDGKMVAAAQEERFTRTKHDKRFPQNAIAYCLEEAGIDVGQIGAVCYYDNMSITLERMMQTQLRLGRQGRRLWMSSMPSWIGAKLNLPDILREQVGYEGQILQTLHHRSHAASAFYMSPFSEAAIVTCDGVGEFATAAIGYGKGNELKLLKEIHFPNSLGLLYAAFTAFTGFKVNSGEYKMMGLAPYGRPRYVERIRQHLIRENGDGSFVMNMDYFDYLGGRRMFGDKVNELLDGPPRKPESRITQREMDIAASIQHVTEDILLRMVKHAKELTGASYLTMAGGVALNCVATGRILREGPFDDIWIQPASGDAGGAMGACLDAYYGYFHGQRETTNGTSPQGGSYWGPEYSRDEIDAFLNTNGLKSHELSQEERADVIAGLLADGKVVGHFVGRMEFGPRALGARSIIADPRTVEMQSKLNLKIKYRESFRPFAPTVLEERVQDYFQMETPSPYMLLVANVKEHRCRTVDETLYPDLIKRLQQPRSDIPAVTHVDYSARIQTINRNDLPQYYDVVKAFERKTGTAVVVNTSFNVRGEPIVCTPEDAYRCFMRTEIDVLVLENRLLFKHEQPGWVEKADWREEFELD